MSEVKIDIKGNIIENSNILNGAVIGSVVSEKPSEMDEIIRYLNMVVNSSNDSTEQKCAKQAIKLAKSNDENKLKAFIKENLGTFVTGTFANIASGALLEIVKAMFGL